MNYRLRSVPVLTAVLIALIQAPAEAKKPGGGNGDKGSARHIELPDQPPSV